eukprot:365318-Chlamydomonas_euryale.AAC.4
MQDSVGHACRTVWGMHAGQYRACMQDSVGHACRTVRGMHAGHACRTVQGMHAGQCGACMQDSVGHACRTVWGMHAGQCGACMQDCVGHACRTVRGMHAGLCGACMQDSAGSSVGRRKAGGSTSGMYAEQKMCGDGEWGSDNKPTDSAVSWPPRHAGRCIALQHAHVCAPPAALHPPPPTPTPTSHPPAPVVVQVAQLPSGCAGLGAESASMRRAAEPAVGAAAEVA